MTQGAQGGLDPPGRAEAGGWAEGNGYLAGSAPAVPDKAGHSAEDMRKP